MFTAAERANMLSMLFSKEELKTAVRALFIHKQETEDKFYELLNVKHTEQAEELKAEMERAQDLICDMQAAIAIINKAG